MTQVATASPVASPDPAPFPRALDWAGYLLGFGLGGFFDGILLHQVLQWHHLLSGLEQARGDVRFLILTDGLFHLLMYVFTAGGLWLLWRARRGFGQEGADRRLFADALLGFGGWHIIDSILSHWILGIHRIRMDAENPLFWDLLWFVAFGIVPMILGWLLRRSGPGGHGRGRKAPAMLAILVITAGPLAALPPPGQTSTLVLFQPGISAAQAMAAIGEVDGRVIWTDSSAQIWAVDLPAGTQASALYRHGALLVSNSLLPAGCLDWIRA